ncbi:unnamed protein product [Didymodactylos carnosus]|uniref:3-hydroxyisobutyrate dehydrogenase n=1 Tax=Didymodactylos carnosus TaxID=1234261 RepID=A0A814E971_9BILA|nr:unnamed protein product [Didymodactylos carnosus]CAF1345079.1 unnamed protein product [Didymodactylos carnosus]CAF3739533.1 unnamed protein product [Didymodactylos carnosus]CAF4156099.1 unnamed protein product [Didymodactylos carnosus]
MGASMASHLIKAGYKLSVFTRTPSKADQLVSIGATVLKSPREVAAQSDVVISIVGYPSDVEKVLLDENDGVIKGFSENKSSSKVTIDMTTSKPSLAVRIYNEFKKVGCHALDAPVSGGDIGAKNAALSIMAGGDQDVFDACLPIFKVMGKTIRLMGGAGFGQHTKMANQIAISSGMIAMVESLLYAQKAGLDCEAVIQVLSSGAAQTFSMSNYGPRILKRNFDPGFYVEHFIKDLSIALEESSRMGLILPGVIQTKMLYDILAADGKAKLGTQALMLALEKLNNINKQTQS